MPTRPKFNVAYIEHQADFLVRMRGIPKAEAVAFVTKTAKAQFTDRRVKMLTRTPNQDFAVQVGSLFKFVANHRNEILSPSGSTYLSPRVQEANTRRLISEYQSERKRTKKISLKAEASGDTVTAQIYHNLQTSIKILLNSIPGGFGSAYNPLYDKGGYNAITSMGRAMIGTACGVCEHLLSDNPIWFTEDEVVNYIMLNVKHTPPAEQLQRVMQRYELRSVSPEELYRDFRTKVNDDHSRPMPILAALTYRLSQPELDYCYYLGNAVKILQRGNGKFWVHRLFNPSSLQVDNIAPADLMKVPEPILVMIASCFSDEMGNLQFYQLPEQNPELARRITAFGHYVIQELAGWQEMIHTLMLPRVAIPLANHKKNGGRYSVILSDTDSVIFTMKLWAKWYTGSYNVTPGVLQVCGLMVYLLIQGCQNVLQIWGTHRGCEKEDLHLIEMKNEFFYACMLLFEAKKVYAGIINMREGMLLSKPKVDIKGVALRGSNVCEESSAFVEDTIVNQILTPAVNGDLDPLTLVQRQAAYERKIIAATQSGSPEYLKIWTVNPADRYEDPNQSAHFYWEAWEAIFAPELGHVQIPNKLPTVVLLKPNADYWTWLEHQNPTVANRFREFLTRYDKKALSAMIIGPDHGKIPAEILPLVNIRATVVHNVTPVYLCFERLGLYDPFLKKQLLFSDLY